jgi:hypothetical protein
MNSPTLSGTLSVGGNEGRSPERNAGEAFPALDFLALDPPREFMRYCMACDQRTCFRAKFELANGLYGVCTACGEWSVVPYTRTVEA